MRDVNVGERERGRRGMRVKDMEREEKKEKGRGKHMNGFKRETLNESELT
jgi:hypothetical protein